MVRLAWAFDTTSRSCIWFSKTLSQAESALERSQLN